MSGRRASARASVGSPGGRVPAGGQAVVDALELGRRALVVAHQLVVAREVMVHQLGRLGQAGHARVQATEEALHEASRHERREQALGRGVEGADVERPRVAQGRAGGARGERLVHVDEVERHAAQQFLDRAPDVDRQRRRPAAGIAGPPPGLGGAPDFEHLAHREHAGRAGVGPVEQRRRSGGAGARRAQRACARRARAPASATGRARAPGGRVARARPRPGARGR